MAAEGQALTSGDYIVHHLGHLSNGKPKGLVDFTIINFDSIVLSALIGMFGCWLQLVRSFGIDWPLKKARRHKVLNVFLVP